MMPENLTVVDLVQIALEYEANLPVIVRWPEAYPVSQILKKKFPNFSNSHIKRLIAGGAVRVNGKKVDDECVVFLEGEIIIQCGKREFFKVEII